jgi:hypothetical protein
MPTADGPCALANSAAWPLVLPVQQEVDLALLVADHVLALVPPHGREAHALEQLAHAVRIGSRELHKFEAVRAQGVLEKIGHAFTPSAGHLVPPR